MPQAFRFAKLQYYCCTTMLLVVLLLFTATGAQEEVCKRYIDLGPHQDRTFTFYPGTYHAWKSCLWIISSPPGLQISLSCPNPNLPPETPCNLNKILVSPTGDEGLSDALIHCGTQGFKEVSTYNHMVVGLELNQDIEDGLMICSASVVSSGLTGKKRPPNNGCNQVIKIGRGKTREMMSPNYPNQDKIGSTCHYIVYAPPGSKISLKCPKSHQPQENPHQCKRWFIIRNRTKPKFVCHSREFEEISASNKMVIAYSIHANSTQPGWAFKCVLSLKQAWQKETKPEEGCDCGWTNTLGGRMQGGDVAGPHEYPMMAAIVRLEDRGIVCGATIISKSYVITAGHCAKNYSLVEIGVLVGETDTSKIPSSIDHKNLFGIDKAFWHWEDDIALIRVDKPFTFSATIGPVCLPFSNQNDSFTGQAVSGLGWGNPVEEQGKRRLLGKGDTYVLYNAHCWRWYQKLVKPTELCTRTKNQNFCDGDNGNPILWVDPSTFKLKLIGIVSWGSSPPSECTAQGYPTVAIRVTKFLDWIQKSAPDGKICKS